MPAAARQACRCADRIDDLADVTVEGGPRSVTHAEGSTLQNVGRQIGHQLGADLTLATESPPPPLLVLQSSQRTSQNIAERLAV